MPKLKRVADKKFRKKQKKIRAKVQFAKDENVSKAGRALAFAKWDNQKKRPEYVRQLKEARETKARYKLEDEAKMKEKKKKKKEKKKQMKATDKEQTKWVKNIARKQKKKIEDRKKAEELAKIKIKKKPPKQDDLFGNKETQAKAKKAEGDKFRI